MRPSALRATGQRRPMELNRAEKLLMNNPVRAGLQRRYEVPLLVKLGGRTEGADVLEIGCGRGVGTRLILDVFGAAHVRAFDLDPDMVRRARERMADRPGQVDLEVGDAERIDAPDDRYDAVFEFGILHHVPNWRAAVAEVHRVLKPGGRFYFEEVTSRGLEGWSSRTFLEHPTDDRFGSFVFVSELERVGLEVGDHAVTRFFDHFLIGVARKSGG